MEYYKNVCGERVPMTPQEIEARKAEEAAWEAGKALREWKARIAATDSKLPRYVEDMIDTLEQLTPFLDNAPQTLVDAYTEKKTIRNEQPR